LNEEDAVSSPRGLNGCPVLQWVQEYNRRLTSVMNMGNTIFFTLSICNSEFFLELPTTHFCHPDLFINNWERCEVKKQKLIFQFSKIPKRKLRRFYRTTRVTNVYSQIVEVKTDFKSKQFSHSV
jgi:hypothetical protein